MKKNNQQKIVQKSKQSNRLTRKEWFILAGFLIVYFFYMKSKDIILNYPYWLLILVCISVLTVVILVDFKKIKTVYSKTKKNDKPLFIGLAIIKLNVVSYFIAGILLIPFNYYNIIKSKKNNSTFENCEIIGISTYSKNRTIFFKFKGNTNVLYAYTPIMEVIKNNGRFKDYVFNIKYKKGLLDSYILESWSIEKK